MTGMLTVPGSKHGSYFIFVLFSLCFHFYLVSSLFKGKLGFRSRLVIGLEIGIVLYFSDQDFLFFAIVKTSMTCCSKWHRLLQMVSTVTNGIDCYKWHQLLQMTSTVTNGIDRYNWH